jgi:AmmeMemoRadiSam system protein B/AmmeMemoRadiSam system protein A
MTGGYRGRVGSGQLGPTVAGRWYPADRDELLRQVDALLESSAEPTATGKLGAVIAPHAGYIYSGSVAASAFRLLRDDRFERVILIGPSHYVAFQGAVLPSASSYRTPLGDVPLDTEAVAGLVGRAEIRVEDRPFQPEHSLEAEIPFLQRLLLPGWRLLPVLVGGGSSVAANRRVAEALGGLWQSDTLVVVSSDFTHYGRDFRYVPFEDRLPERIEELDMGAVERIVAGDCDGFADYVARTGATICGQAAIQVLLRMMATEPDASVAAYDTSGRLTGSWDHSVSYAGLTFSRPREDDPRDGCAETEKAAATTETSQPDLAPAERRTLLELARIAIEDEVYRKGSLRRALDGMEISPAMRAKRGVFVTLKKRVVEKGEAMERLRGCIGTVTTGRPLVDSLVSTAPAAAMRDPRFPPVSLDELAEVRISVSVLTPLARLDSIDDLVLGKHGVQLVKGSRSSIFLPQVAVEQGWDVAQLLRHLALKAGLPPDGWHGAEFWTFEAEVFSESDFA